LFKIEKTEVQVSFDLTKRIDLRAANKKALENLILAGGFDSFRTLRSQYFHDEGDGITFMKRR
jgi:DNA polymerase-3 subunit alpha